MPKKKKRLRKKSQRLRKKSQKLRQESQKSLRKRKRNLSWRLWQRMRSKWSLRKMLQATPLSRRRVARRLKFQARARTTLLTLSLCMQEKAKRASNPSRWLRERISLKRRTRRQQRKLNLQKPESARPGSYQTFTVQGHLQLNALHLLNALPLLQQIRALHQKAALL